jgi:hypothetical protein
MPTYPTPDLPGDVNEFAWEAAIAEIRAFCGWHIAPEVTETLTIDGPNGFVLHIPTLRLVDVVSITNDGNAVDSPEWSRNGLVRRGYPYDPYYGVWTWKMRGVVAEVTHGFEEWPEDLLAVATAMAKTPSAALAGVKSVTSGPHSFTLESSITAPQLDVLYRYQLPYAP